jgi:hypothetical protein
MSIERDRICFRDNRFRLLRFTDKNVVVRSKRSAGGDANGTHYPPEWRRIFCFCFRHRAADSCVTGRFRTGNRYCECDGRLGCGCLCRRRISDRDCYRKVHFVSAPTGALPARKLHRSRVCYGTYRDGHAPTNECTSWRRIGSNRTRMPRAASAVAHRAAPNTDRVLELSTACCQTSGSG